MVKVGSSAVSGYAVELHPLIGPDLHAYQGSSQDS